MLAPPSKCLDKAVLEQVEGGYQTTSPSQHIIRLHKRDHSKWVQHGMAHMLQNVDTENDSIRICGSPEDSLQIEGNTFFLEKSKVYEVNLSLNWARGWEEGTLCALA